VWFVETEAQPEFRGSVLAYLDTRTGQQGTIPGLVFRSGWSEPSLAVDRRLSRLFVSDTRGVWVIDPMRGVRLIPLPVATRLDGRRLQAAGGRLFLTHWRFFGYPPEVLVIDPDSGAHLANFPQTYAVEFSRDERTFYLTSWFTASGHPDSVAWVHRHDMDSLTRRSAVRFGWFSTLIDDMRLSRQGGGASGPLRVIVHDADGRNVLREALHGVFVGERVTFWRPGAGSPIYAESDAPHRIDVIDPETFTVVHSFTEFVYPAVRLAVPQAPAGLHVTVSGHTVSLSWDAMEHAGEYEVEAGSRSGLRDLARFRTGGPAQMSVRNVPSGTYYVRVRAGNAAGTSAPSNEAILVVTP
jgi:hypothetical protein